MWYIYPQISKLGHGKMYGKAMLCQAHVWILVSCNINIHKVLETAMMKLNCNEHSHTSMHAGSSRSGERFSHELRTCARGRYVDLYIRM